MSQILTESVKRTSSQIARLPYGRNLRLAGAVVVLASIFIPVSAAQTVRPSSQVHHKKQKAAPPVVVVPAPAPVAPPPPPPVLTPEEMPPRAPEVSWDGKQLTINAENSTLSDILSAVHASTGATIDMPPGSGSERIAVRLGPAPVREVLSSLLYGTNFDYIIQASSTNEDGIQSVILTTRGKSDDAVVATGRSTGSGVRRMIGYADSAKTNFEAAAESALERSAAESPAAAEVAPTGPDPGSASAETAATNSQPPVNTDTSPASQAADAGSGAGAELPSANLSSISPSTLAASGLNSNQTPSSPPSITDLQRLYEQRRQIQMQQNQAQQNQTNPPRAN